ncbi:unknown [Clostridium sp. CAG:470]|nr:unknown [Clostridium sp. CAG:470]
MALKKEIELENGIIVNYHRIVSINKVTNNCNIIEVASYTSEKQRNKEKEYYESTDGEKRMNVFIETEYIQKEYLENETIEECYEYLKKIDKFKDAKDVLEKNITDDTDIIVEEIEDVKNEETTKEEE